MAKGGRCKEGKGEEGKHKIIILRRRSFKDGQEDRGEEKNTKEIPDGRRTLKKEKPWKKDGKKKGDGAFIGPFGLGPVEATGCFTDDGGHGVAEAQDNDADEVEGKSTIDEGCKPVGGGAAEEEVDVS